MTDMTITPFDAYEIHGCKHEIDERGIPFVEPVDNTQVQFWTLFGHIPGSGLEAIGDFETQALAEEVLQRIAPPVAQAAPDLLAALEMAVTALNTARCFRVPGLGSDSYAIAATCDRAIVKARGK